MVSAGWWLYNVSFLIPFSFSFENDVLVENHGCKHGGKSEEGTKLQEALSQFGCFDFLYL